MNTKHFCFIEKKHKFKEIKNATLFLEQAYMNL